MEKAPEWAVAPTTRGEAEAQQLLRGRVELDGGLPGPPTTVPGLDVSPESDAAVGVIAGRALRDDR